MSLSKLTKIDKELGAIFNSHIDGKKFILAQKKVLEFKRLKFGYFNGIR